MPECGWVSILYSMSFYRSPLTWVSLYDSPPLVSFQGLFACRKWFCFLDLKIKKGCGFGFRYGIFSGKGNKGEYSMGCYFLGYIYKVLRLTGWFVWADKVARLCGWVGWVGCGWVKIRVKERTKRKERIYNKV